MRHLILFLSLFLLPLNIFAQAEDLFFSEYIEGTSNNKYLEIYNGTGSSIDLSDYEIHLFANGAATPNNTESLSGTLLDGSVLVIKNSSAVLYDGEAITSTVTFFNGNDAVALIKKSTGVYVDIFGHIGEDPGSAWTGTDGYTTQNATLVRKPTVTQGVMSNPASGFPTLNSEWDIFATDMADSLGNHYFTGNGDGAGESDIIKNTDYVWKDKLESTVRKHKIASLMLRDGGEAGDDDDTPTVIETLSLSLVNAQFFDSLIIETTTDSYKVFVEAGQADFTNLSIVADDDNFVYIDIYAVLAETLVDNESIGFSISSISVAEASSGMVARGQSFFQSPSEANVISVTAIKSRFSITPPQIYTNIEFILAAEATDEFGNRDIDESSSVSLHLNDGSGSLTFVTDNSNTNFVSGFASWKLTYDTIEEISFRLESDFDSVVSGLVSILDSDDISIIYESIAPELNEEELIAYLQENYSVTNSRGYNTAREFMYAMIDNIDGYLTGVYTGEVVFVGTNMGSIRTDTFNAGINTEHTWPQGYFDQDEPMRSDLHHLFPTIIEVNGARGNLPFGNIDDNDVDVWYRNAAGQTSMPSAEMRGEFSRLKQNSRFQPRDVHKGDVARALFYFWTIYKTKSNVADDASFFNGMSKTLRIWHQEDPPTEEEMQRSDSIAYFQGNHNPFIHDTSLVMRAYFYDLIDTGIEDQKTVYPQTISVSQNYPNPFNPTTHINVTLNKRSHLQIVVYSILGKKVDELNSGFRSAGEHSIQFDGASLSSGIYIYQVVVDGRIATQKKMTLIK